jgi:hypothetical protein
LARSGMEQLRARAVMTVNSTARWLMVGSTPGRPMHTGQACVLGGVPA